MLFLKLPLSVIDREYEERMVWSAYKDLLRSQALFLIKNENISIDDLQLFDDDKIISIINRGGGSIVMLLNNPSAAVQVATFRNSIKTAKCFESPCEELKALLLFT